MNLNDFIDNLPEKIIFNTKFYDKYWDIQVNILNIDYNIKQCYDTYFDVTDMEEIKFRKHLQTIKLYADHLNSLKIKKIIYQRDFHNYQTDMFGYHKLLKDVIRNSGILKCTATSLNKFLGLDINFYNFPHFKTKSLSHYILLFTTDFLYDMDVNLLTKPVIVNKTYTHFMEQISFPKKIVKKQLLRNLKLKALLDS